MKFASPKLCLVLASAALVLAGCSKRPPRPDPGQTMMGPQPGSTNTGLGGGITDATFGPGVEGLTLRDGGFNEAGENHEALADQTVYFDFDKSDIKASERPKLQAAKAYLDSNPGFRLVLEGRCDWRGTAEYNLGLGDRRANAAKRYLQSIGVPADRIETRSKGSLEAAKNADDATMAKDRRVDLIVVNPSTSTAAALPPL